MKKIIGAVAGTVAAVAVCVVFVLAGPTAAANIFANDATVTFSDGEVSAVNVDVAGDVSWLNYDSVPSGTLELYFGPIQANGDIMYSQVQHYTMSDDFDINATSGNNAFTIATLDLTDPAIWGSVPTWANDAYFSAGDDGSNVSRDMAVRMVVSINDGETNITKEASDSFTVTVQNLPADADFGATVTVSVN